MASNPIKIATIADALSCTRKEFAVFFLQAQVGLPSTQKVLFELIATADDDRGCFYQALYYSQTQGWLNNLIDVLVEKQFLDQRTIKTLAGEAGYNNPFLQAISSITRNFSIPDLNLKGIQNGMRWTGKVIIDGTAHGSGVLIGAHLFLTSWHVVDQLFEPAGRTFKPKKDSHKQLKIQFDDYHLFSDDARRQRPSNPRYIDVPENWCVYFSECHKGEINQSGTKILKELNEHWDYTIIKLAKAIGLERKWASLDPRAIVPGVNEAISVFQYPKGEPLKYDTNVIIDGGAENTTYIPRLRFLHDVNTYDGSSGGPCFDKNFNFFGLHQGSWTNRINRGVPLRGIIDHIKNGINELPELGREDLTIWNLGSSEYYEPVLGVDQYQQVFWQSIVTGKKRLLLLQGEKGKGKTFLIKVTGTLLNENSHLKILLNGERISKMDVLSLAGEICKLAGVKTPSFVPYAEENSTISIWLKDMVVPNVINCLQGTKGDRLVWLFFTELNIYHFDGSYISDFLYLLYEQLLIHDWLRIILDGMQGDLPDTVRSTRETFYVRSLSADDFQIFFTRFFADFGALNNDLLINFLKNDLFHEYQRLLAMDSTTALNKINSIVLKKIEIAIQST